MWNNSVLTGSAPALTVGGVIYVGYNKKIDAGVNSYIENLYAINSSNGENLMAYQFSGEHSYDTYSAPVIAEGMVYSCAAGSNAIYAFGSQQTVALDDIFFSVAFVGASVLAVIISVVAVYLFLKSKKTTNKQ